MWTGGGPGCALTPGAAAALRAALCLPLSSPRPPDCTECGNVSESHCTSSAHTTRHAAQTILKHARVLNPETARSGLES
eukprot:2229442-Rhodomonas_salina.1